MPRTTITPVPLKGGQINANSSIYTSALGLGVAADTVNMMQGLFSGSALILVARAPGGARTVTVTSAPDQSGRSRDITTDALGAGATRYYGPFPRDGWAQTDGMLYFTASQGDVLFDLLVDP